MSLEVAAAGKLLEAVLALHVFPGRVVPGRQVGLEVGRGPGPVAAVRAEEAAAEVERAVQVERAARHEPLLADVAQVGPLAGVRPRVLIALLLERETLAAAAAVRAEEGLQAVHVPHVRRQLLQVSEALRALARLQVAGMPSLVLAHLLLVLGAQMQVQPGLRRVGHAALGALESKEYSFMRQVWK